MRKQDITITHHGRIIIGTLVLPLNCEKCPLVILSHGYNGSGLGFSKLADFLACNNIAAFYFDFCGGSVNSKSSLPTTSMTIFTEKEDLIAVLEAAGEWTSVDDDNIYLFGESQGGLVSALVAKEYEAEIKGLVLLYPALCIADNWNERFAKETDIPEEYEFWGMNLGKNFFTSLRTFNTFEAISGIQKRVLVMHGDKDPVVPLSYSEKIMHMYSDVQLEVFEGEGHGFTETAYDKVCEMTKSFVLES